MQSCAAGSILMASLPIARTDLRTKCTSISVAYLERDISKDRPNSRGKGLTLSTP